jgi:hypothetical protein
MPPKSVAWQLFHDLFGEGEVAPRRETDA